MIVSPPPEPFAWMIACRSEPAPALSALVTMKLAAPAGPATRAERRTSEAIRARSAAERSRVEDESCGDCPWPRNDGPGPDRNRCPNMGPPRHPPLLVPPRDGRSASDTASPRSEGKDAGVCHRSIPRSDVAGSVVFPDMQPPRSLEGQALRQQRRLFPSLKYHRSMLDINSYKYIALLSERTRYFGGLEPCKGRSEGRCDAGCRVSRQLRKDPTRCNLSDPRRSGQGALCVRVLAAALLLELDRDVADGEAVGHPGPQCGQHGAVGGTLLKEGVGG